MKDKLKIVRDYIVRHCKVAFPIVVVAAVAVTVAAALSIGKEKPEELREIEEIKTTVETSLQQAIPEIPLVANENGEIYTLLATYYNAVALGDVDTILSISDEVSDMELLRYQVSSQYIENYPVLEIYTKAGPETGSTIAYVYYRVMFQNQTAEFPGYQAFYICTGEDGTLYIKRGENSEEVNEYIKTVNAQADVVEFNNRINEEYNQLMIAQPELLEYLSEFDEQVNKEVGVILAQQSADGGGQPADGSGSSAEGTEQPADGTQTQEGAQPPADGTEGGAPADTAQPPAENVKQIGTATTTVNVRSSDSEQADKVGKVAGGTQLEVLENRANGWSKVLFEGQEGYVKTEFLQITESTEGVQTPENGDTSAGIGTVTANTNINIRASANESSEKLGVLVGGDSAELLAKEGDWCKIRYNGNVGYVKAEYVQ